MNTPRFDKLITAWMKKNPLVAGEVRQVTVAHDDHCRMLRRKGDCNCNPDFSYDVRSFEKGDFFTATFMIAPPAENN